MNTEPKIVSIAPVVGNWVAQIKDGGAMPDVVLWGLDDKNAVHPYVSQNGKLKLVRLSEVGSITPKQAK
jgi:hypothetical protein